MARKWSTSLAMVAVICLSISTLLKAQTKEEIENNPNTFHMFENFDLTKNVYINETKIVKHLLEIKRRLQARKEVIEKFMDSQEKNYQKLHKSFLKLHENPWKMEKIQILTGDFPDERMSTDYIGSCQAIIKLQFAYQMNLTELSENGRIQYLNSDGQIINFDSFERLNTIDFANLGEIAKKHKLYDISIDFTKEGIRLYKVKDEGLRNMGEDMHEKLIKQRKNLIQLNNVYLEKRRNIVGKDFQIKPYFVDKNLSQRKKQPNFEKFWRENEAWDTDMPADYEFMQVCQKGQNFPKRVKTRELKSRYLHHQNPYLKLGPFKEEMKSEVPYAVVFHDILYDTDMNYLIEESSPKLSRKRSYDSGVNISKLIFHLLRMFSLVSLRFLKSYSSLPNKRTCAPYLILTKLPP